MNWFVYNIGSHNIARLSSVVSVLDQAPIEDADVTVRVIDQAGDNVAGATWPIQLPWDADSASYLGSLPPSLDMTHGQEGQIIYVARRPGSLDREWRMPLVAVYDDAYESSLCA
ncbi:MAG: hypothetical protein AAF662_02245 [Pseudomonadota bacterium]